MAFLDKLKVDSLKVDSLKEKLEAGVKAAQENVSSIDVDSLVKGAKDAVAAGAGKLGDAVEALAHRGEDDGDSSRELVALLWCLALADGSISAEERASLAEISVTLDEGYESYAEELEQDLIARIEGTAAEFGRQHAAKIEAQRIIDSFENDPQDARLLCWNLLALANSDGLDEVEADFIRFVSEKTGVDPAVFEELRNHSDAIVEIGKSIELLRASDRPYAEIEPLVAEFSERQQAVVDAIHSLVSDR